MEMSFRFCKNISSMDLAAPIFLYWDFSSEISEPLFNSFCKYIFNGYFVFLRWRSARFGYFVFLAGAPLIFYGYFVLQSFFYPCDSNSFLLWLIFFLDWMVKEIKACIRFMLGGNEEKNQHRNFRFELLQIRNSKLFNCV